MYIQSQPQGKKVFLIDMKQEKDKVLANLTQKWIKKYIKDWKKILFLINKKWYSSGIICQDCGFVPKCSKCDIPIAYHKDNQNNFFGICHICNSTYQPFLSCPHCWSTNIKPYWIWTQKLQEILKQLTNQSSLIIESSVANSPNKLKKIEQQIQNYQMIIGTSLLNFPPKNRKPDLIIIVNADIGLNVPDFNANYQNFLFVYQTILHYDPKAFLIQTFHPQAYSLKYASNLDFDWFKKEELSYRQTMKYPPFGELAVLLYKNEIEQKLFNKINKIYQDLEYIKKQHNLEQIELYPTPPLIYKAFGKYRYNIIIKGDKVEDFLHLAQKTINFAKEGFQIDINPVNLI